MRFHHVLEVEVTDAISSNRSCGLEGLKGRQGFGDWYLPAPVKEIQIDIVSSKPSQTAVAGSGSAFQRCVVRVNLADEEHFLPPTGDRLADQPFCLAFAIHFCCVNKRHPEIQPIT